MLDTSPFTETQWLSLCKCEMEMPVPLHEADLTLPFVYDREWGVFYTPGGRHIWAMATLYAFHKGYETVAEYMTDTEQSKAHELADKWILEYEGTAFRSSVGRKIIVGRRGNLNAASRQCFKNAELCFVEED